MIIIDGIAREVMDIPRDFPEPDISNPLYIAKKTIVENGQVIGGCLLKLTSEGILILDPKLPDITKARAIKEVIKGLDEVNKLDDCHVFVKDQRFKKLLERLGFMDCKGGSAMVLHL
jgi:hypothetical protein